MSKISVVIPACFEPYLSKTIQSLYNNAVGEIEVIVVLDGWQPDKIDKRVKVIKFDKPKGMRIAINAGIESASNEFIMKTDAHCMFAKGFDEVLVRDYQNDWLVIPRRYALNEARWNIKYHGFPYDYEYLSFPNTDKTKY